MRRASAIALFLSSFSTFSNGQGLSLNMGAGFSGGFGGQHKLDTALNVIETPSSPSLKPLSKSLDGKKGFSPAASFTFGGDYGFGKMFFGLSLDVGYAFSSNDSKTWNAGVTFNQSAGSGMQAVFKSDVTLKTKQQMRLSAVARFGGLITDGFGAYVFGGLQMQQVSMEFSMIDTTLSYDMNSGETVEAAKIVAGTSPTSKTQSQKKWLPGFIVGAGIQKDFGSISTRLEAGWVSYSKKKFTFNDPRSKESTTFIKGLNANPLPENGSCDYKRSGMQINLKVVYRFSV